jgi:hypothetical protein
MNSFSSIVAPFSVAPRRTRCDNPDIGTDVQFRRRTPRATDSKFIAFSSRMATGNEGGHMSFIS